MLKITVITPSFNQAQFLEQTIDSVLSQRCSNLEYFIIDGGSTDGSVDIIKRYEKHLAGWVSEKDRGQSHAINKGLKLATGDVINWINSDDYLAPGALKNIAEAFQNPETHVFIGKSNIVQNGNVVRQSRGTDIYNSLAKTMGRARIDQPEHWWRKSVIDKIGLLNENLHYTMDRDWWVKYLLMYGLTGILKTETVLANFRLHPDSKTVSESNGFFEERNHYFAGLAACFDISLPDSKYTSQPKNNYFSNPERYEAVNHEIIYEAIQHYLMLLADELYLLKKFRNSKSILNNIDSTNFHKNDLLLFQKLKWRSLLSPKIIRWMKMMK